MAEDKKVLLSLRDVDVKFNVRGRILSAIRNVSLDVYENESLAIVGESGSGKSVLTKTFAGMLDDNGFISHGNIIFSDDDISKVFVSLNKYNSFLREKVFKMLNRLSVLERGSQEYLKIKEKQEEIKQLMSYSKEEEEEFSGRLKELDDNIIDKKNYLYTLDRRNEKDASEIIKAIEQIKEWSRTEKTLIKQKKAEILQRKKEYFHNRQRFEDDKKQLSELNRQRCLKIKQADNQNNPFCLKDEVITRNSKIADEILLSIARYPKSSQLKFLFKLHRGFKKAMVSGEDLKDDSVLKRIFESCVFRVELKGLDKEKNVLEGYAIIDCSKIKYTKDWQLIRGRRIATVFQDPMTSLNPVVTIGKQIMSVILKHQHCTQAEAKERTLDIMAKVGIPEPEKRFNDYPFQYSGGMRQRIVIAIALSCQPKILICDEPTTALDVTIQAQILQLIKDLQKQLGFTTVYITHDLGVVANVADRVAVLYGGQIVELGTVEEIFYDPKHPYTWALLSSLTQLAQKGEDLFSIPGTPPSLYNKITGDAFAPRNKYVMAVDLVEEPPMFKVSETHYAKTWLLDSRAPAVEKPEIIRNLHEKMVNSYKNFGGDN